MTLLGLHTYIAFKIKPFLYQRKMFFTSFLMGSIIPDIDIILVALSSMFLTINESFGIFYKTITHSLITAGIVYLLFLIAYELKKSKAILNIAYGVISGIIIHILVDILIGYGKITLFWPLPIGGVNGWAYTSFPYNLGNIIVCSEFILFRLLASQLINAIINSPIITKSNNYIRYLTLWMKIELYFFLIIFLTIIFIPDYKLIIFIILYIPSYIMSVYSIYILRRCF